MAWWLGPIITVAFMAGALFFAGPWQRQLAGVRTRVPPVGEAVRFDSGCAWKVRRPPREIATWGFGRADLTSEQVIASLRGSKYGYRIERASATVARGGRPVTAPRLMGFRFVTADTDIEIFLSNSEAAAFVATLVKLGWIDAATATAEWGDLDSENLAADD